MASLRITFIFVLAACQTVFAVDDQKEPYKEWLLLSGGRTALYVFSGSLTYSFGKTRFYQVGLYANSEFTYGSNPPGIGFIAVSIGRRHRDKNAQFSYFVGPSYVKVVERGEPGLEQKESETIGVLFNLQLLSMPAKTFGFGVDVFSNVNFKKSDVGVRLALLLGNGK